MTLGMIVGYVIVGGSGLVVAAAITLSLHVGYIRDGVQSVQGTWIWCAFLVGHPLGLVGMLLGGRLVDKLQDRGRW